MSTEALINILIGSQAGLLMLFIWHLFKCRDTRVDIATIKQSLQGLLHEIGDHERGIRGEMHTQANALTRHELDIRIVKQRLKVDER